MNTSTFERLEISQMMTDSMLNVFETMLSIRLEACASTDSGPDGPGQMVVGSVGFAGKVRGVVYIHFSDTFAGSVSSIMMGMTTDELGESEVNDVVGELSNMIGGGLKSRLTDAGLSCQLSVPTVMRGEHLRITPQELIDGWKQEQIFRHESNIVRLIVALKPGE